MRKYRIAAVILLGVLQIFDLISTRLLIERGAQESNNWVEFIGPTSFALWGMKLTLVALVGILAYRSKSDSPMVDIWLWVAVGFYLSVPVVHGLGLASLT